MEKKTAKEMVEVMSDFVNRTNKQGVECFIKEMGREHRTLQQGFTGICLKWLEHLASLEDLQYDERNKASVETAKEIVNDWRKKHDGLDFYLPLI
jgi:hypothetical protein